MKHDVKLQLPANWQSIPRARRLQYLGELDLQGFQSWPVERRRKAENKLAIVVGLDTGTLTAAKVRELRTIMRGEPCLS